MSQPDAINPWRGERVLVLSGMTFTLAATMDTVARLFTAFGATTLADLGERIMARSPAEVQKGLAVFLGDAGAADAMRLAEGFDGLTRIAAALVGAVSGLTPDEEDAAKKAEAVRAQDAKRAALDLIAAAMARRSSDEFLSPNG